MAFARSFMKVFSHLEAIVLPALDILLPAQCLFCDNRSKELVCQACHDYFPMLSDACQGCATPLVETAINRCERCQLLPPHYDSLTALYTYQAPISAMIKQLKYTEQLQSAQFFAAQFAKRFAAAPQPDYLIAMPLHETRLKERGYNQAALITHALSQHTKIPVFTAVRRNKPTLPQTTLSAKARAKNLANAFQCQDILTGMRVAIIDDVITTGATVQSLSRVLRKAGAIHITVYCCAKAELTSHAQHIALTAKNLYINA